MVLMKSTLKSYLEKHAPKLLYTYQIWRKRYSEPEISLLPTLCKRNAISLDIGANRGLYSYYMLPHSSAVLAFEPLPEMQKRLRTQFGNRVTIYPVALSDTEGQCDIRLPKGNPSWATIDPYNSLAMAGDVEMEVVKVETRRLDSYDLDGIGFIKIDVEGHEESVLHGAEQTIRRNRPILLIEIEERHNAGAIKRVSDYLHRLDYKGTYLLDSIVKPMATFDERRDQPIEHLSVSGKHGRYINNFIFWPSHQLRVVVYFHIFGLALLSSHFGTSAIMRQVYHDNGCCKASTGYQH